MTTLASKILRKSTSFRPNESLLKAKIKTLETELDFNVQSSTTGKQLFDQVATAIGLREVWFFGLQFKGNNNQETWLDLKKPVNQLGNHLSFHLRAKFHPEYISDEVHQEITLRLFYLQAKEQILRDEIICTPDQAVLLAACSLQASDGDYSADLLTQGAFDIDLFLSRRVTSQYKLSEKDWEGKIIDTWTDFSGMSQQEAMIHYLTVCEELEMYGISYFNIRNKKGKDLYFGVLNLGVNVYDRDDQLNPRLGFRWDEIKEISFSGKKFTIQSNDKKTEPFIFFVQDATINQQIIQICMGNHELYLRRRQPEADEIIKLRQEIREEKLKEQEEKERRIKEHEELRIAEAKQRDYEEKLNQANMVIQSKDSEILQVQQQVQELERELAELSDAREQLKSKEQELNKLNDQLRSERALGEEERTRLIGEINERESQIVSMKEQINSATIRTSNLQREVSLRKINVMSPIPESSTGKFGSDLYTPVRQIDQKRSPSWINSPKPYSRRIEPVRSSTMKPALNVDEVVKRCEPAIMSLKSSFQRTESNAQYPKTQSVVQRTESKAQFPKQPVVQRVESKWSAKSWQKHPPINRIGTSKWTDAPQTQNRVPISNKWDSSVQEMLKSISQKLEGEQGANSIAKVGVLSENGIPVSHGNTRRQTLSKIQGGNTKNRVKQFENL